MPLPVPTPREVRWAFIVGALAVLILATTLAWAIVHKVNQSDEIVHIAASGANQIDRLNSQLDAQAKTTARERATAQRERRLLRAQLREQKTQLRALVTYLKAHGINVPDSALGQRSADTTRPKASTAPSPTSSPRPSDPASPAPTPTPTPASPPVTDLACQLAPLVCH